MWLTQRSYITSQIVQQHLIRQLAQPPTIISRLVNEVTMEDIKTAVESL
jgi:hypothetical protein